MENINDFMVKFGLVKKEESSIICEGGICKLADLDKMVRGQKL